MFMIEIAGVKVSDNSDNFVALSSSSGILYNIKNPNYLLLTKQTFLFLVTLLSNNFFLLLLNLTSQVLYTGDYSRQEDRHLMAAEIPELCPDVLIVESTYGIQVHEPRKDVCERVKSRKFHSEFNY